MKKLKNLMVAVLGWIKSCRVRIRDWRKSKVLKFNNWVMPKLKRLKELLSLLCFYALFLLLFGIVAVPIGAIIYGAVTYDERVDKQYYRYNNALIIETLACQKAGFVAPEWIRCGPKEAITCFACTDEKRILHTNIMRPECSRNNIYASSCEARLIHDYETMHNASQQAVEERQCSNLGMKSPSWLRCEMMDICRGESFDGKYFACADSAEVFHGVNPPPCSLENNRITHCSQVSRYVIH